MSISQFYLRVWHGFTLVAMCAIIVLVSFACCIGVLVLWPFALIDWVHETTDPSDHQLLHGPDVAGEAGQ